MGLTLTPLSPLALGSWRNLRRLFCPQSSRDSPLLILSQAFQSLVLCALTNDGKARLRPNGAAVGAKPLMRRGVQKQRYSWDPLHRSASAGTNLQDKRSEGCCPAAGWSCCSLFRLLPKPADLPHCQEEKLDASLRGLYLF